ncbi:hypothetical protein FIBSPDRAFT_864325 [Athelia psychrophila]|uniref:Uncharacterized protein n=1 Tax=Athelia psychrophila TaxID=1759441 RepID=A0A166GL38_9AGAM|nr:hypothetical protein FIBSPDRAFT_864325 [Fibularhizoctonia sp. CBS 109695]
MDDGPAVPPKPTQWLSRSPVNSTYIPAPAEASGSAAQEGPGLFAEMTGHQKQMEADADAGRATGSGGLQAAREAPPRYSLD